MTKMIREVDEPLRDIAMQNLFTHANARAKDPVGGLYKIFCDFKREIESAEAELHLVKQQIAFCRSRDEQQQREDLSFGCYSYGDLLPQQVDYGHVDGYANQNMYQYQGLEQQLYQEMLQQQQLYQEIPQQQQHQEMQLHQHQKMQQQHYQEILQHLKHLEIHQQQHQKMQLQQYEEIPLQLQQHQQMSFNYGTFTEMPESTNRVKFYKEEQEIPQQLLQNPDILQQLQHQEMQQHQQTSLNYEMFSEMPEPSSRAKLDKAKQKIS